MNTTTKAASGRSNNAAPIPLNPVDSSDDARTAQPTNTTHIMKTIQAHRHEDNQGAASLRPKQVDEGEVAGATSPVNDDPSDETEANEPLHSIELPQHVDSKPKDREDLVSAALEGEPVSEDSVNVQIPTCNVDLDSIAVDQDFAALTEVKPDSSAPPIRKPGNQLWFYPHPDRKHWRSFLTIRDQSDKEAHYIIDPSLATELEGEWSKTLLVPCITPKGEVFFLPIKLPDSEGRIDSWNTSRLEHIVANPGMWVRHRSNSFVQGYDKITPLKQLPPPIWPDDLPDLLKKSVGKVFVGSLEHPLVKRLRGDS